MSFTWKWIQDLLTQGLSEAAIRRGAMLLAAARGWNHEKFADFIMFLYALPSDVLKQVEAFIGHSIVFGCEGTPPGATDSAGGHDPDLPEACNEFKAQLYMLRGAVMEELREDEELIASRTEKPKKGKKPAEPKTDDK